MRKLCKTIYYFIIQIFDPIRLVKGLYRYKYFISDYLHYERELNNENLKDVAEYWNMPSKKIH